MSSSNDHYNDNTVEQRRQHLVLIGGGHAHVQVIKALNHASRPKYLDVTLIDMTKTPTYSGMVPGAVAGIYQPNETQILLEPLARWAGIRFVHGKVLDVEVNSKYVQLRDMEAEEGSASLIQIPFDVVSIDIGSASRGLDHIPGAREYTIPTRPISDLVKRIKQETEALQKRPTTSQQHQQQQSPVKVVVVGAGAAGIELSMSIRRRWAPIVGHDNIHITVLDAGEELLPNESIANRQALRQCLQERNIAVKHETKVQRVEGDCLLLESGDTLPFTHCLWAAGAASHSLASTLQTHGLSITEHGWIRVNQYLQSLSHPYVFAAGDCSSIELPNGPNPPKAGVFAVRAGPILIENLTKYLKQAEHNQQPSSSSLTPYQPQSDFMKLLTCGDGKALGFRFGIPIYGKWVFELKDTIDRSFMDLFKKENLPELNPKVDKQKSYDTSQYDARGDRPPPMDAKDGAALLQRTDDDVDFQQAWNVIRDMADDDTYREAVLKHIAVYRPEMA
ncbi:selenide water dikinase [Nitzschia inconspicua]|uniref:Selenide water dikinase n=1 Tax=Nitzschia inconspicua TaxID=303405 RepID=A0A9K3KPD3_9STRA|nr:selenide water dikinase [Nitzschia inconspicua]